MLPARAARWPTSPAARAWHPASWWLREAFCIHRHESVDWHRAWVDWRGRHSVYAGGMQFTESTWVSVGGRGEPWQWSPREQLFRSWLNWLSNRRRWSGQWGTATVCGLR